MDGVASTKSVRLLRPPGRHVEKVQVTRKRAHNELGPPSVRDEDNRRDGGRSLLGGSGGLGLTGWGSGGAWEQNQRSLITYLSGGPGWSLGGASEKVKVVRNMGFVCECMACVGSEEVRRELPENSRPPFL